MQIQIPPPLPKEKQQEEIHINNEIPEWYIEELKIKDSQKEIKKDKYPSVINIEGGNIDDIGIVIQI